MSRFENRTGGYLKDCRYCGTVIYMYKTYHGSWIPFESWVAGTVTEGEWVPHHCPEWAGLRFELNALGLRLMGGSIS